MKPLLIIFSGLPGTGKTTLSKEVAKIYKASYFRLDTIEHGLRELCSINVQGEGYRLTYRIASENLGIGNNVVIDCCNPIEFVRNEWEEVANINRCDYLNIEIICSDKEEHKKRVENRKSDINGFYLPSWKDVEVRIYEEWNKNVIQIDSAGKEINECLIELLKKIENEQGKIA